jgi:hypothetical protein
VPPNSLRKPSKRRTADEKLSELAFGGLNEEAGGEGEGDEKEDEDEEKPKRPSARKK